MNKDVKTESDLDNLFDSVGADIVANELSKTMSTGDTGKEMNNTAEQVTGSSPENTNNIVSEESVPSGTPEASQLPDEGNAIKSVEPVDETGVPIKNRFAEFERKFGNSVEDKLNQFMESVSEKLAAVQKPVEQSKSPSDDILNMIAQSDPDLVKEVYNEYQGNAKQAEQNQQINQIPEVAQKLQRLEQAMANIEQEKEKDREAQVEAFIVAQRHAAKQAVSGIDETGLELAERMWEKSGYEGMLPDYAKKVDEWLNNSAKSKFPKWLEKRQQQVNNEPPASSDNSSPIKAVNDSPLDFDDDARMTAELLRDHVNTQKRINGG